VARDGGVASDGASRRLIAVSKGFSGASASATCNSAKWSRECAERNGAPDAVQPLVARTAPVLEPALGRARPDRSVHRARLRSSTYPALRCDRLDAELAVQLDEGEQGRERQRGRRRGLRRGLPGHILELPYPGPGKP
jgi:hypothetical protein